MRRAWSAVVQPGLSSTHGHTMGILSENSSKGRFCGMLSSGNSMLCTKALGSSRQYPRLMIRPLNFLVRLEELASKYVFESKDVGFQPKIFASGSL